MLNYDELRAPAEDGGTLVVPLPPDCTAALRANRDAFRLPGGSGSAPDSGSDIRLLDRPLSHWRQLTRECLSVDPLRPVIVVGHQPAFIHPGVWAKNIVADRIARALGGTAVNLVVDTDAPAHPILDVPTLTSQGPALRRIRFADLPAGFAYEQIPAHTAEESEAMENQVRDAMGECYDRSLMPRYFKGFRSAHDPGDWVDQAAAGRRAIENDFGVSLVDRRVSGIWWSPLLVDMILHAHRFAEAYNAALRAYRQVYRVRGLNRPIPDLEIDSGYSSHPTGVAGGHRPPQTGFAGGRVEIPVWAYRRGEARRRLMIERRGSEIHLVCGGQSFFHATEETLRESAAAPLDTGPWVLRPRALTLTLWARLLLADLFIHGIGGAKYDRITDDIFRRFYGIAPPLIACVSATLRLDLPRSAIDRSPACLRRELRDLQWNPHRHFAHGDKATDLLRERQEAIKTSLTLRDKDRRNRVARREAFRRIRDLNQRILETSNEARERKNELRRLAERAERENRIAAGREYFFALHSPQAMERLLNALPQEREFRV